MAKTIKQKEGKMKIMLKIPKKIIKKLVNLFGYTILSSSQVKRLKIQTIDEDTIIGKDITFLRIYDKCKEYTMTSKERMYTLYKSVEYIINAKIPGDFVECGVWRGGSTMLIAYTLLELNVKNRKIYMYDTYEGMTKPTADDFRLEDNNVFAIKIWEKKEKEHNKFCYASLSEVKNNMALTGYPENNNILVKGKIEETIPKIIPDKISLLRLDTDWYESTKHELIHLFQLLSKSGVLIIDDYGYWAGAKKAVDEYFATKKILLNRIDEDGRIGIKTE